MPTKRASPKRVKKVSKRSYKKKSIKRSQKKRSYKKKTAPKKRSQKKRSVKRKSQRGGVLLTDAEQKQYNKFMRAPMESYMDKFYPSAKKLMESHGLSLKDSLYIAVAEKYYPKEAKKYFDTVENLVYGGMKVKDAAKYAFEQYMMFYKELNSPQKGRVVMSKNAGNSRLSSMLKSTFF